MSEDIKQENLNSTYAVKLDGEVKQELLTLLDGYKEGTGANAGDFIKTLLQVYKTNKIINKASGGDSEIKELNTITNRIYDIYSNLIKRNDTNNNSLQVDFGEQLSQKDNIIITIKDKLQTLEQEKLTLETTINSVCDIKINLENNNKQLQKLNDSLELNNSKLLEDTKGIHDLKQVNNKLLQQLEEYKKLLSDSQSKNVELNNNIKDNNNVIDSLKKTIEKTTNDNTKAIQDLCSKQAVEVETLKDKAIYIKDKALLEVDKAHQAELQKINIKRDIEIEQYQNKITQHQTKYNLLIDKIEELRTTKVTTKNTVNKK